MSKTTHASKLSAKAAAAAKTSDVVPKTTVSKTKKESPKKTITPTKEDKPVKKESLKKISPKPPKADEVPDEVPPSLEKKKSSFRSFMARDGPQALGSKSIPEVREKMINL